MVGIRIIVLVGRTFSRCIARMSELLSGEMGVAVFDIGMGVFRLDIDVVGLEKWI